VRGTARGLRWRDAVEGGRKEVARPERFELPTLWFEARCSIQLSYGRVDRSDLVYGARSGVRNVQFSRVIFAAAGPTYPRVWRSREVLIFYVVIQPKARQAIAHL
jgi:hypothetical protein